MRKGLSVGAALVVVLALLVGGLGQTVTPVHAAATSAPSGNGQGNGVGGACQGVFGQEINSLFTYFVSSFLGTPTPITVSQGACASFVANLFLAGQLDTSAPFVSICKSVATDYSLGNGFIGPCVSFLSTNKALIYSLLPI